MKLGLSNIEKKSGKQGIRRWTDNIASVTLSVVEEPIILISRTLVLSLISLRINSQIIQIVEMERKKFQIITFKNIYCFV